METLPNKWADIKPDVTYHIAKELLVSFSQEQIKLGVKYDLSGKHLKAIEKGQVPPRSSVGLVPSQEEGYDLKSKILCKGGDNGVVRTNRTL
jgi:hypothetical protein